MNSRSALDADLSDLLGQYDFTSGTAVFSNGYLHDAVVQFTSPA